LNIFILRLLLRTKIKEAKGNAHEPFFIYEHGRNKKPIGKRAIGKEARR